MTKHRRKPKPAKLPDAFTELLERKRQERDPQTWGVALNFALPSHSNVDAEFNFKGQVRRALRLDVFSLLFYRPGAKLCPQSYDAVRRFQKDLAILHATQGSAETIRTTSNIAHWLTENFSLARADAGSRIHAVLKQMPPSSSSLMLALCEPEVIKGQIILWHTIVQRHTGETNRIRRAERVRQACDDLAQGYRTLDNLPARKSA